MKISVSLLSPFLIVGSFGNAALGANTSRAEMLGTFEKVFPTAFCDAVPILKRCYTIPSDACSAKAQAAVKACTSELKSQIPDPVTGAHEGAKWSDKVGSCFSEKMVATLNEFKNKDATLNDCKQALADLIQNRAALSENARQITITEMTRHSTSLEKMLAKLSLDDANQFIAIMTRFPKAKSVTPEMHAKLWSLITKMDLKNPVQIEELKNQSLGETINHQIQIWEDALQSLKQGSPIKSAARSESEKRVSAVSSKSHLDFKADDELIANVAAKKPIAMGGPAVVYDETKIKKMLGHLKKKQDQLEELYKR